jgi:NAD(P)H-dependent nitrite reductase small subunit
VSWRAVCKLDDVLPNTRVCALIEGRQIALFRIADSVFATDNYDPASEANVLSRGLVGDLGGERVVASPIYKHHYGLTTGRCLEDPAKSVSVYPVRVIDGEVWLNPALTGIELYQDGKFAAADSSSTDEALVLRDPRQGIYKRLVIRANKLHGVVLYGDARHGQWYFELMTAGQDIAALRDQLLFGPLPRSADLAPAT